jgi:hypothetical protein
VRERIEYRFRVPSAAVFTLYSYSKALEYPLKYPTTSSLRLCLDARLKLKFFLLSLTSIFVCMHEALNIDKKIN